MNNSLTAHIRNLIVAAALAVSAQMVIASPVEIAVPDTVIVGHELNVHGMASVIVRDLTTGFDIVSQNADRPMTPASTLKCLTAAAVMLNPASPRFYETDVMIDGPVNHGVLWGNLVVKASGDPTTESEYFQQNHGLADSIASRLSTFGVKEVKGSVIIDSSAVPDGGPASRWTDDDRRWYYGAGHFALNYRDNLRKPDRALADPPGEFFDDVMSALASRGITVDDEDIPSTSQIKNIYRQQSPPVNDILRSMMVRSDNMFAEAMLRSMAPGNDIETAVDREKQILATLGINTDRLTIYDGSGLTRQNSISPSALALTLQKMLATPVGSQYVALFPKAGIDGTVRRFLKDTPLEGEMLLKSGSVSGVQCYAGYKTDNHGTPTHVVVVMVNQFTGKRAAVVESVTEFLCNLFHKSETETAE